MIRRFFLYTLCFSVVLLYCCNDPLDPEGPKDPTIENPTTPEEPAIPEEPELPPIPVDPDDPSNPEKPVDPPVDPSNPEKPVDPPVDPSNPEKPVDPPVDPSNPEKPVDPPVDPVEPEKPIDPVEPEEPQGYVPQILLLENFTNKVIPDDYKIYDEDKHTELFSSQPGSWITKGDGVVSYAIFASGNLQQPIPAGTSMAVDNWIVTKGVKINRPNTKLSWYAVALGYKTPAAAVDSYEVYISTVGQSVADMKSTMPIYSTATLKQGIEEWPEIDLDAYVGKTIYIAFRHCTPIYNMTLLRIANIKVREYSGAELGLSKVQAGIVYDNETSGCVFRNGQQVEVRATVYNNGTQTAPSVEASYTYNKKTVTETFIGNIARGASKTVVFSKKLTIDTPGTSGQLVVELENDEILTNNRWSSQIICPDKEPEKRVLAEKLTSTSCGPCGSIINTLDKAESKYPDKVIGVAIHTTFPSGDQMECRSYLDWVSPFYGWAANKVSTAPKCSMNKIKEVGFPTIPDNVMTYYNQMVAPAALSVDVSYDTISKVITATANTTFAFSSDATYKGCFRIGFVITEDNLQAWQKDAPINPVTEAPYDIHNHTARALIGGPKGFANSLPETVVKDAKNTFTVNHTIPAQYDNDKNHSPKPQNMSVVAILYNDITGEVLNCARTKVIQ